MAQSALTQAIYAVVARIPRGCVATYGQVALLAGHPRCPRQVGQALHHAPAALGLPCHRVVNRQGRPAPGWPEQRYLLEAEGIPLGPDGRVDVCRFIWDPARDAPEGAGSVSPAVPARNPAGRG